MEKIDKDKVIQDYTLQFQAMADNLALATSPDDAIRVLKRTIELMEERKQEPASDDFQIAVRAGGTLIVTCEGCQRTYFASGDYRLYEDGQLEELQEQKRLNPQSFVEISGYDDIEYGYLNGKTVVVDCDCNYVRNFERLFWNHRWLIEEFFKLRTKGMRDEAAATTKLSRSISSSINKVK